MSYGANNRRGLSVIALYAGAVLIGMALVSVPASSVFLLNTHGLSDSQYGQIFLPQLVFAIAGALLAGPAVRRLSPKTMWSIALACLCFSQIALWCTTQLQSNQALLAIMVCTGFFGFGFGFGGGPLNGLVATLFSKKADTAITALHLMAGVGLMLGPIYIRYFEAADIWAWAPAGLAIAAIILLATTLTSVKASREKPDPTAAGSPASSAYFWFMIVIAFLYALVEGAFSNWAVIFVTGEKAQTPDTGARALAVFWAGLTVGRLLVTLIVARLGARRIWMILPVLSMTAFWLIPNLNSANALVLGFGFAGLTVSAFFPLMVAVAAQPFPQHVSWIASMLTASLMLGVGVGSYLIGLQIESVPISQLYHYMTIVPVVTLLLMIVSTRLKTEKSRSR